MSWEEDEKEKGWTRREWVRLSLTAGAIGSIGALGGLGSNQRLARSRQNLGWVTLVQQNRSYRIFSNRAYAMSEQ